jgi:mRNA-degrading endonuclease RelE of RelBE toxin-antitoxin system
MRNDPATARRVQRAVDRYAEDSLGDVRKLHGGLNEWRLRVGDWRVRFEIDTHAIVVLRILPRGRAYRD